MRWRILFLLASVAFFSACGPKPPIQQNAGNQPLTREERQAIVETAKHYLDTPYKYTGLNSDGFDCSGFVYSVYLEAISLRLPRSTKELYTCTRPINLNNARPGDLIFFSIRGKGRPDHVGLYLENSDFIHSSKSKGVVISTLNDDFYGKKFLSARRLRPELIVSDKTQ
jgi:cell wall-associated NlpC family hydrolase